MKIHKLALAVCLAATTACVGEAPTGTGQHTQGLDLALVTPTDIAGTFVTGEHVISFRATEVQDQVMSVQFRIGERVISMDTDFRAGFGSFEADSAAVDEADVLAFTNLAIALESAFPGDHTTRSKLVQTFVQQTSFMAIAPVQQPLTTFDRVAQRSITCLSSCGCSNQYIGNGYWRQAGKSSSCTGGSGNGCKGRCGVGCGSNGGGYYTHDCARHDYGLAPWRDAFDDYSWGWSCSC